MNTELLRLFKGYQGAKSEGVNEKALTYGLLISNAAPAEVVDEAIKMYGIDGNLWNQTFHKDWKTVAETPIETLILQQLVHYITTYGFEALGIYNEANVYVPAEALNVPELKTEGVRLTAIVALSDEEITAKLMTLLSSGIALSEQTVKDIKVLSDFVDRERFDEIANREVRNFFYEKYNIMPKDPEAFLRYLMYRTTGATLKIQNVATYQALAYADKELVLNMLQAYGDYARLSSIFLRNKNLFLALKTKPVEGETRTKTAKAINAIINKLRKLAVENHKALKPALLDSLSYRSDYSDDELNAALDKVTVFRAIRVMNMLAYRLNGNKNIVYRVRNGKSYVSQIPERDNEAALRNAHAVVMKHIADSVAKNVSGKTVYIPAGFTYMVPASEKQFVNNVPEGSYYELPDGDDLVFATHWVNLEKDPTWQSSSWYGGVTDAGRVDLDMRMMNNSSNFGWNASYRSGADILFSGDMTNAPAPNGATEAIYVSHTVRNNSFVITLNDFTCHGVDVPYEFIIAKCNKKETFGSNYVIDPNNIVTKFNLKITPDKHQVTLGMVKADEKTKRFYFNDYAVGRSGAVSRQDKYTMGALSYMNTYAEVQMDLAKLLTMAGAKLVDAPTYVEKEPEAYIDEEGKPQIRFVEKTKPVDINLSIEALTKDSIIELFR